MAKSWPEHGAFFEAVGKVLARFGTPKVVRLDRGRVRAYLLENGIVSLLSGPVVVIPKFVAGTGVAPKATQASWLKTLPDAVAQDYPQATGILLTNSHMENTGSPPHFQVWDRGRLLQIGRHFYPDFGNLVPMRLPGVSRVSDMAMMPGDLTDDAEQSVPLPFVTRIAPKGWVPPGPGEVLVVPVDPSGSVQGGYTGSSLIRDMPDFPQRFRGIAIDAPRLMRDQAKIGTIIVATAYTTDNSADIDHAVAAIIASLDQSYDIHDVYLPLLGATVLGARGSYQAILAALQKVRFRLSLKVIILIPPGAIPQGELVNLEGDVASGILSRPAYSCDAVADGTVKDALGIAPQAQVLAGLLADRNVAMPLAVGLFGPWGSGKSFFMRLVEQAMDQMVKDKESHHVDELLPIRFNAWHYMDSDLWASLARTIFGGLAEHLNPSAADPRGELQTEIESSEEQKKQAEAELARAKKARQDLSGQVQTRLQAVWTPEKQQAFLDVVKPLGITELPTTVEQVRSLAQESQTVKAMVAGMLPACVQRVPAWILGAAVFVGFGVCAVKLPSVLDIDRITAVLAPPLASLGATLAWMAPRLRKTVTAMQGARQWLVKAQDLVRDDGDIQALQQKIAALDTQIAAAAARLAHIDAGGAVYDFLQDRGRSQDYVGRQGIVAILRKDLEGLQDLWAKLAQDGKKDRRIVLYVDDLDRCDPDRVVEVLQAVHLLLAFPLFAVVVAVDPRWLEYALYKRYLPGHEDMSHVQRLSSQFSPQNYLEKIFQIPVRVGGGDGAASATKGRYDDLIDKLTSATPDDPESKGTTQESQPDEESAPNPGETSSSAPGDAAATPEPDPAPAASVLPLPALELEQREKDWMKALAPLLPTPRTVKRLYNVYALIRLEKAQHQALADFLLKDFRPLLLMLAVDFGFPLPSRFVRAAMGDHASLSACVRACREHCEAMDQPALAADFAALEQTLSRTALAAEDKTISLDILDLVSRFSFHDSLPLSEVLALEKAARDSDTPTKSS